jgi:hypothetical protein
VRQRLLVTSAGGFTLLRQVPGGEGLARTCARAAQQVTRRQTAAAVRPPARQRLHESIPTG